MASWTKSEITAGVSALCAVLSALCAILVFIFGVWQNKSSENWKRSEFVTKQITDFNADRANQIIVQLIEYDDARVELWPGKPRIKVSGNTLIKAINEKGEPNDVETEIQLNFVHFLKSLARLNYYLERGYILPEELCPDFGFSIALMTGDAREMVLKNSDIDIASFAKAVGGYLDRWQHREAKQFMETIRKTCK